MPSNSGDSSVSRVQFLSSQPPVQIWTKLSEERKRKEKEVGEVVRDTTVGGGGVWNYITGFEGSQAVPACPSGIGSAY
jgi:hypothetical protein